jgi:NitT/TauT family transport system substrate-binding protein
MVDQMTRAYLETHGLADSTDHVDTGFDTVQQLLTGQIDAAGGVFSDAVDARKQGYRVDTLPVHESIPSYGHTVAVGESFASDNPATVGAFLRATARGAAWASRNPAGAIDALVEARPELAEVRENQRGKWDRMRSGYLLSEGVREHGWGWSAPDPWEQTYETLAAGGFFENSVDPASVWTNEYLDTDGQYVGGFADRVTE